MDMQYWTLHVLETHQHDHTPVEDSSVVAVATIGAEQRLLQLVAAEETDKMSQAVADDMFSCAYASLVWYNNY